MAYGDTTSGISNFSEIIDIINAAAMALEPQYMVMGNLVTRHDIPNGEDRVRIPFQTVTFEAQQHTDGDEIAVVQQFGIDTIDLTCSELQITYRISRRALRQPSPDLAAMCAEEQAKAAAEALEVRLLSLLDDSGSQDLGASGAATTLAHIRTTRRMLKNVTRLNGGKAPVPIFGVINAIQEENLLTDLGVTSAQLGSTNVTPRVINNVLEQLLEVSASLDDGFVGTFLKIPFFTSEYIAVTNSGVTAPSIGGVFSKSALHLGVAADWDLEPFSEVEWPGKIVRAMTDYGQRLCPYPQWVVQFDTAVA